MPFSYAFSGDCLPLECAIWLSRTYFYLIDYSLICNNDSQVIYQLSTSKLNARNKKSGLVVMGDRQSIPLYLLM